MYIYQFSDPGGSVDRKGVAPKERKELPTDITELAIGDWMWSEVASAWVGWSLDGDWNGRLYQAKIMKA